MGYLLWLLFMGLIVGFVAYPIAQRAGYSYGRFGRTGDLTAVVVGTLLGGVVLTFIGGLIGLFAEGTITGAIIGGIIGALLTVGFLAITATKAAADEPNKQEDIG